MTTTSAPLGAPTVPPADPTAVFGRRVAAYVIDAVVLVALVAGVAMALWEHSEITEGFDDGDAYCEALLDATDFGGQCIAVPADTPLLGDYVYLVETSDQIIQTIVPILWIIANLVLLQGLTGASVGKLITGLRVVNPSGRTAGLKPSAIRTVLWVVDAAPWIFPLVGLITAVTTNGHRRVGDMAASTFVVGRASVGAPIQAPSAAPPADQMAWGADQPPPQPQREAQPWVTPAPTQPQPQPQPPVTPAPTQPAPGTAPAPEQTPEVAPAPEPVPELRADEFPADEFPVDESVADDAGTGAGDPLPAPQWDDARNAYLQWDPAQNAWLQWDDVGGRWKPIDS